MCVINFLYTTKKKKSNNTWETQLVVNAAASKTVASAWVALAVAKLMAAAVVSLAAVVLALYFFPNKTLTPLNAKSNSKKHARSTNMNLWVLACPSS
jgi:hypothetical protein